MFKEEIATALKTKYQRFGLSNEAIDRIASAREKTVTSEGEVEAATADVVTMELIANELQKMRDKEISNKTDLQRAFDTYKEKNPEGGKDPKPEPNPNPNPTPNPNPLEKEPEWAKKLRERYEREDREREDKERRDALTARLKTEGCSNGGILKLVLQGYTPGKDESEDDAVKRMKESYCAAYRETFGDGPIPGIGQNAFIDPKSATDHKNDFLRKQGLLPQQEK